MPGFRSAHAHLRAAAAFFTGFLVHCSLYPYAGWRDPGAATWDYWLGSSILPLQIFFPLDAALNVLAYIPLGCLVFGSLPSTWRRFAWASALAWLTCTGLSAALELTQAFLPGRISSKVDLACNSLGAAAGVLLGREMLGLSRRKHATYVRSLNHAIARIDWEVTPTLGIWVLCLMEPQRVPFVMGPWLADVLPGRFEPAAAALKHWSGVVGFLASLSALTGPLMLGLSQVPPGRRRLPCFGLLLLAASLGGWLLPQTQNLAAGVPVLSPLTLWGERGVAALVAATVLGLCVARSDWSRRDVALLSLVALCATIACTAALPGGGPIGMMPERPSAQRIITYLLSAADGLGTVWSVLGALAAWRLSRKAF